MDVSVILCTYNRCALLPLALESVLESVVPESLQWELLIVDNNSPDRTRQIVETYSARFPGKIHYLFERTPGKSNALNLGIRHAQGEILAFMDDDVRVDREWLVKISSPLLQSGNYAGVGGRIVPPKDFVPPGWLPVSGPYSLGGILAFFDFGESAVPLTEPPFGTNMAFRKSMFETYGGFRADLGPCPGTEIRGEDTEFGRRLLNASERLWYEPAAIVYHPVPPSRLEKPYFLRFLYDHGRAVVREHGRNETFLGFRGHFPFLCRIVLRSLPQRVLEWQLAFNPPVRFSRKCMVWMTLGEIAEILYFSGDRTPASEPNFRPLS